MVVHPQNLLWWQWGKILGLLLPPLFWALGVEHLLVWAIAAHIFADFTAQSYETAMSKAQRGYWALAYHAFIAGGYPGFITGGLAGLAISMAFHFTIDLTNKFGFDDPLGPLVDQAAHIVTIILVWWWLLL